MADTKNGFKVEELSVYYRYDVNVELGAEGFDSEGYEPEPLNMQGAVGVLIALAGVVLYKL